MEDIVVITEKDCREQGRMLSITQIKYQEKGYNVLHTYETGVHNYGRVIVMSKQVQEERMYTLEELKKAFKAGKESVVESQKEDYLGLPFNDFLKTL